MKTTHAYKLFVPGRLCLFGEHSDWAGGHRRTNSELEKGLTIVVGTNQGIHAEVRPHPDKLILHAVDEKGADAGRLEVAMQADALLSEARSGGFFSYAAGVAYNMLVRHHVRGLDINNYKTDLPAGKGLSSSAAICVLVARAFNRLYDLNLTVRGEMEAAYHGEITTPSRCGRMDQGCAYGNRPILMTFDADIVEVDELVPGGEIHIVIVDLHAKKDTKLILTRLNEQFPFATTDLSRQVQKYLGEINRKIVLKAVEAIQAGDARRVGELMSEAQGQFDKYIAPACPEELASPRLHKLLAHGPIQPLIWGGKGVGSQGDGTAQIVARSAEAREEVIKIVEKDLDVSCLRLDISRPLQLRKAVIPAAGFGTRMFPASKGVKKELFPFMDSDGLVKPIIVCAIEEALSAGIEQVALIIRKEDTEAFNNLFKLPLDKGFRDRLPDAPRRYAKRLDEIGRRVTFIIQKHPEGLGHAVLQASEWVGQEPFLLMLGDHLYRSGSGVSCARQLTDMYEKYRTNVVSLAPVCGAAISNFGAVAGHWDDSRSTLTITRFVEKPTLACAQTELAIEGAGEDEFLTVFGHYILSPGIFRHLEEMVADNFRENGEFQLTTALERQRHDEGCLGCIPDGKRYDVGNPEGYLQAMVDFAASRRGDS